MSARLHNNRSRSCSLEQHAVDSLYCGRVVSQLEFLSNGARVKKKTAADVLAQLKLATQSNAGFIFSVHAFARAGQRTISHRDVVKVFLTAATATEQSNGNWLVKGLDEDGDELTVVVTVNARIEIVTVF